MDGPRRPDPKPSVGGGAWDPSPWFLVIAAVLLAGGLLAWWTSDADRAAMPSAASSPASAVPVQVAVAASGAVAPLPSPPAASPASASTLQIPRMRDPNGDQTPDLADYVNPGELPTIAEVIARLHQAGVHSGLGAFSPPGTSPPLVGLAVPEGFALPEGYVRHYQATDDGQPIEAILMFAPDFQLLDNDGRPIVMPEDRVVPPELAPPGLPIRRIVIPAPTETPRPGG